MSVEYGARGTLVQKLQKALLDAGYLLPRWGADGIFGQETSAAISAYCVSRGLIWDGQTVSDDLYQLIFSPYYDGIDVSSHQSKVNWKKVAATGVRFAWVKCSEGTTHKNKRRQENLRGARDNGILVGGYHFALPRTYQSIGLNDAEREAANFLKCYGTPHLGDLVPALDLETGLIRNNHEYNLQWTLKWAQTVEAELGLPPYSIIMYTARWAVTSRIDDASKELTDELAKYPLWWAEYRSAHTPRPTKKLWPWEDWNVWQWTGTGSLDGVKTKVDRNRIRIPDLKRLVAKIGRC